MATFPNQHLTRLHWETLGTVQVTPANQFLVQAIPNAAGTEVLEFVVNAGCLMPPTLLGELPDGQPADLFVQPSARMLISRSRLVELRDLLTQMLDYELPPLVDDASSGEAS